MFRVRVPGFTVVLVWIALFAVVTNSTVAGPARELWVPAKHLEAVLAKNPKAVVLTSEQYETLIRDARKNAETKEEIPLPVSAAITKAELTGELNDDAVRIVARYEVESFTDEWTEVPLPLDRKFLGRVTVNEESAIRAKANATFLLIHGKGVHEVEAEFQLPVKRSTAGNAMSIRSQNVPVASLELTLSDGAEVDSALPFVIEDDLETFFDEARARFVIPPDGKAHEIRWTSQKLAQIPNSAIFQTCSYLYSIDETRIQADLGFVVSSSLAELPRTFTVTLDEGLDVLSIEGSEVLNWRRDADHEWTIELVEGDRTAADIRIIAEQPLQFTDEATIELPVVKVAGIHRQSGTISILGSEGIRVKNIETGPLTVPIPDDAEGPLASNPDYVSSFRFPVEDEIKIAISQVKNRFQALMDTDITLGRESIDLTRNLRISVIEGRILSTEFTLPMGEELKEITTAGIWEQVSEEENRYRIVWPTPILEQSSQSISVLSRRDPAGWFELGQEATSLDFASATIEGVETTSGYVAVNFNESFRVETGNTDGLEPRDGRTTPVTGTLAWFRLDDYSLTLDVARRSPEIEADLTTYALPLQNTIEIEGQLDLGIRYTPIGELTVGLPPEISPLLRFDSPLLAEKRLDEETGQWTLVFHDEKSGAVRLRFRMSLPFEATTDEATGSKTFAIELPVLSVPEAKTVRGDWVMEANTDTELTFAATGLDAVDSLQVPIVEGYVPRHRVIASYQYRGDEWKLSMTGTRHAEEALVTTVIDALRLDSVLSADGGARHQALLSVRTTGDQFLSVELPDDSALWTLTIDNAAVKPVASQSGTLRIAIPSKKIGSDRPAQVKIVYETPGKNWGGSGREKLIPIELAERIPILSSEWYLHLPEGYDYQKFRSNLREEFEVVDRTLLGHGKASFDMWNDPYTIDLNSEPEVVEFDGFINKGRILNEKGTSLSTTEVMERQKQHYYDASKDQTRAKFLSNIAKGWEVPYDNRIAEMENKLKSIIIPNVEFDDMPLGDAIDYLTQRSIEADPDGEGLSFSLRDIGDQKAQKSPGFEDGDNEAKITLRLSNVPLAEALRYTTELAQLKFKVEPDGIVILPQSAPTEDLVTRVYTVPPGFLSSGGFSADSSEAPADPFAAPPTPTAGTAVMSRPTAKDVLESAGITFPEGSTATYDPVSSRLIIKNTRDQNELVEIYTDSMSTSGTPDIRITSKIVDVPDAFDVGQLADGTIGGRVSGFGFDWKSESENPEAAQTVIPSLSLNDVTLAEAIETLEQKAREVDGGAHAAFGIQLTDEAIKSKRLTLKLDNVPLAEAVRYITDTTSTDYTITSTGIVIAAPDKLPPASLLTAVFELPNEFFQTTDTNGSVQKTSARHKLESMGVTFPAGTSAAYNFTTQRMAIRTTPDQLEMVEVILSSMAQDYVFSHGSWPFAQINPENFAANAAISTGHTPPGLRGFKNGAIGLIPLDFTLPESGRSYRFSGFYAPKEIRFRYVNWERQIRFAWVWIAVGGLAFWFGVVKRWKRPIFGGLLGVITLTFIPLIISKSLLAFCNSLLIGWLVALGLWIVWRVCSGLTRRLETTRTSPKTKRGSVTTATATLLILLSSSLINVNAQEHTVILPYDDKLPINGQKPQQYWLSYETFQRLWKEAKSARDKVAGPVTDLTERDFFLSNALYRAEVREDRLQVEGRLSLTTRGKQWQQVPLAFGGVNIVSVELDGAPGSLRDGGLLVEQAGAHEVVVTFEIPMTEKAPVSWKIPSAAASMLAISLKNELAEPVITGNHVKGDCPLVETLDPETDSRMFTAALGGATNVTFRERLSTTGRAMTRPNFAEIDSRLFVSPALERLEATFRLEFSGQEENSFMIAFDPTLIPIEFDIPNLSTWKLVDGGQLLFELTRPVRDSLTVKMIGERIISAPDDQRSYPYLTADATRVQNVRTILRTQDLSLKLEAGGRHQQTNLKVDADQADGFEPVASYALAGDANDPLTYQASERTADRRAVADYVFQVGDDKLETIVQFQLRSPDSPLLGVTIDLPQDAAIQTVTGTRVKDWWRSEDGSLTVRFSGGTPEVTALLVYLARELDADATEAILEPMKLHNFDPEKVKGSGMIVSHLIRDTVLRLDQSRSIIREVDANTVAQDFEILPPLERKRGLRFERGDFSASVSLTPVTPKYDATWVMMAQARENAVSLSVLADIEITRSATRSLSFSTEETAPEFRVISEEIREVTNEVIDGRRVYTVTFQRFITDAVVFTLEAELSYAGSASLPDVLFSDASRQERYLIVENHSDDRMKLEPEGLDTTVKDLIPYTPSTFDSAQLFRARPDWGMEITLEELKTSAGNNAIVMYAELTSVFRANGEEWLSAKYRLQNRSLQFLPVLTTDESQLVSVTVAGEEVRADKGQVDGRDVILVPLIQTKPGQLAYDVELIFHSRDGVSEKGHIISEIDRQLDDPEIVGVPVEKTLWNVYLPRDHQLEDFEGNMDQVQTDQNVVEVLESNLMELRQLNKVGSSSEYGFDSKKTANKSAESLIQQIEQRIDGLTRLVRSRGAKRSNVELSDLKRKVEQQKVVLTENRVELPLLEQSNSAQDQKTDEFQWVSNSGDIARRDAGNTTVESEQLDRVANQWRFNDNISIGNGFFDNNGQIEGDITIREKDDLAAFQKQAQSDKYVGKSKGGEVDEKLDALNDAQIGHGGVVTLGKEMKQQIEKKAEAPSDPFAAPASDEATLSYTNARSQLRQQDRSINVPMSGKQALGVNEKLAVAQKAVATRTAFDDTLRAAGRRSISVNLPTEGNAYHFKKLKDHAELEIETVIPATMERGKWLVGLALCLGILMIGEWLRIRRMTRRAS